MSGLSSLAQRIGQRRNRKAWRVPNCQYVLWVSHLFSQVACVSSLWCQLGTRTSNPPFHQRPCKPAGLLRNLGNLKSHGGRRMILQFCLHALWVNDATFTNAELKSNCGVRMARDQESLRLYRRRSTRTRPPLPLPLAYSRTYSTLCMWRTSLLLGCYPARVVSVCTLSGWMDTAFLP
jgi:hypothetical protein